MSYEQAATGACVVGLNVNLTGYGDGSPAKTPAVGDVLSGGGLVKLARP
jgi:hypothetical protein